MNQKIPYILGLDLGTNSVGWAIIRTDEAPDSLHPIDVEAMGVRIFSAGVDGTTADIQTGRDESRNASRQNARQQRKRLWRRRRRMAKVFGLLQRHNLLPSGKTSDSLERHALLNQLDASLRARHLDASDEREQQLLPYILRTKALDQKLELFALGRAIYHLAQRRGFLSNRKQGPDPEDSKVYSGINELQVAMEETGARTLGEYFASLDPAERRIRERWTARAMFSQEFDAIWSAQAPHHPATLSAELHDAIRKAIFYQRPLKTQKHKIGQCSVDPTQKRCPWWRPEAQEFRYLQRVNDLRIIERDGSPRLLTTEQRKALLAKLSVSDKLTFKQIRALLKLPQNTRFNLQLGGESKLPGHQPYALLNKAFGPSWGHFTEDQRHSIYLDLASVEKDATFIKRCIHHGMTAAKAEELSKNFALAEGYCMISAKALQAMLPAMRTGKAFATVRDALYPPEPFDPMERLPPVFEVDPTLNNPTVIRTLTELRKVVNALVRLYGKPRHIRLEMGRDLKRSRDERKKISQRNRAREKQREAALKSILSHGYKRASSHDIEKVLLAEECNYTCPYTGEGFGVHDLIGESPIVEVEHIIPYSRSLDNSFANKTLCYGPENRRKRNKTPFELYGETAQWDIVLDRVARFSGDYAERKLERFQWTTEQVGERLGDFTTRQLNDTRYAAKSAAEYLGCLFGAVHGIDPNGKRRITAVTGQTTAILRRAWKLEGILGNSGLKTRDDHRHHAIDALTIGLTTVASIQALSKINQEKDHKYGRIKLELAPPIPDLGFRARELVEDVVISPRVQRTLSGALHEETLYGRKNYRVKQQEITAAVVRRSIEALSKSDIDNIVDPAVRYAIEDKLAELGQNDPKKAFTDVENRPRIGRKHRRINKVRVRKSAPVQPIGEGATERLVLSGSNHHVTIFELRDAKGRLKWDGEVVSLLDAIKRKNRGEPVVKREREGARFVASLCSGDVVSLNVEGDARNHYYVVRGYSTFSSGFTDIKLAPINDSRTVKDMVADKSFLRTSFEGLRKSSMTKVEVLPLGDVREAGG